MRVELSEKDKANLRVLNAASKIIDRAIEWAKPKENSDVRDIVGNLMDAVEEYHAAEAERKSLAKGNKWDTK